MIDSERFVEVRREGGVLSYYEGFYAPMASTGSSPKIVSYEMSKIASVSLSGSWSISLIPPETIVIVTGTGSITRRRFGS